MVYQTYDAIRAAQLESMGSRMFSAYDGIIAAGATVVHDMTVDNPEIKAFQFADSIIVTNNSAQPLEYWHNGAERYYIPAYSMQPVMGRPANNYKIVNVGAGATVANDVFVQYRRLAPSVQKVVAV
jgi:hypothetical protein